jgi:hypothetical protein
MSQEERDRLRVMSQLQSGQVTQIEAGKALKLTSRQVRRIFRRYQREGDAGLVHRLRGRPSNRKIPQAVRKRVLGLIKARYTGFGPTLASEYLASREKIDQRQLEMPAVLPHLRMLPTVSASVKTRSPRS